jgi:hypothetical protein
VARALGNELSRFEIRGSRFEDFISGVTVSKCFRFIVTLTVPVLSLRLGTSTLFTSVP